MNSEASITAKPYRKANVMWPLLLPKQFCYLSIYYLAHLCLVCLSGMLKYWENVVVCKPCHKDPSYKQNSVFGDFLIVMISVPFFRDTHIITR